MRDVYLVEMNNMGSLRDLKKDLLKINPDMNFNKDERIIGNEIFAKRHLKGLSREELAKMANVNPNIVKRVEGGLIPLSDCDFGSILKALGINKSDVEHSLKQNKIAKDEDVASNVINFTHVKEYAEA